MPNDVNGLLVLDKPLGITSRAAVDRALKWFPRGTRIGHTGTLDPLATGVLVLCLGAATRLAEYVQCMEKTYVTRLHLGARSSTDDAEGIISSGDETAIPSAAEVAETLPHFVGEVDQIPPAYSAAKIDGRRAYAVARKGHDVTLAARRVQIHSIETVAYEPPFLELEVRCGKGTYIRSLARDIGERLGCGAYVETLRRLRVGSFDVTDSVTLDANASTARARLLPLEAAVSKLPSVRLVDAEVEAMRCGRCVKLDVLAHGELAVFDTTGTLVGVALADGDILRPMKVLAT